MSAVWVAVIAGVCSVVAAGGKDIIAAVLRRLRSRGTPVERAQSQQQSMLEWMNTLKDDAEDARRELTQVRQQAGQAINELVRVHQRLTSVEQLVERILQLIHHTPDMTLERLRTLVPDAPARGDTP